MRDFQEEKVLRRAADHSRDHIKNAQTERPFPTTESLDKMDALDIDLKDGGSDGLQIIDQLHEIAGPACVHSSGGRYFGFVTGGVLPVALAARWLSDAWDQNAPLYICLFIHI